MITQKISSLFQSGGACINLNIIKDINKLDFKKVISVFEEHGIILLEKYIKPEN